MLLAGQAVTERLDHLVTTFGALGATSLAGVGALEGWWGGDRLHVIHGPGKVELDLDRGTTFSVLAMHGPCRGVTVEGARWPLVDHHLEPLVGRGVSNEAAARPVSVSVTTGIATVVIPGDPV